MLVINCSFYRNASKCNGRSIIPNNGNISIASLLDEHEIKAQIIWCEKTYLYIPCIRDNLN